MARQQEHEEDDGFGETSRYTAHLDRGWSLLDRGDLQQARNSAHQALEIRPDVPDGAMLMAAICLAESDPESSLEWYERAIEADSEYVDAQLAAAQILLYDLDDPHRALARAELARELDEATIADLLDLGVLEVEALVAMGEQQGARERLAGLSEQSVLEELLSSDTPREQLRSSLEQFCGEPFEADDDWDPIVSRAVQLAIRIARLQMDLGAPEQALPWLERLLRSFGDDPDVWYLANEAAYLAGDPLRAAQAALQVVQADAAAPAPEWSPSPTDLHAKVVNLLLECVDPQLRALAREPGFAIVVNDAPPFELVLEGVDPRVRSLALAARNVREVEAPPVLTGLVLYRRNLVRLARDPALLDREIALAVFDELAVFFGFDEVRRERLGLAPSDWGVSGLGAGLAELRPARREHDHDDGRRKPHAEHAEQAEPAAEPKQAKRKAKRKTKKPASEAKPKPGADKPAKPKPGKRKSTSKPAKLLDGKAKRKAKPADKPKAKPAGDEPIEE